MVNVCWMQLNFYNCKAPACFLQVLYLYRNTWNFPFASAILFIVNAKILPIFTSSLVLGKDINRMEELFYKIFVINDSVFFFSEDYKT